MEFNKYQEEASQYAIYRNKGSNYEYPLKGLFSEVGEIADKFKKIERDRNNIITDADVTEITKELGDALWYISQIAWELEISLDVVAQGNLHKLKNRKENNTLKGSGDNR